MESDNLKSRLLDAITKVHTTVALSGDLSRSFDALLDTLLEVSGSAFGFVGEIRHKPQGAPYLRTWAVSNIAWDQPSQEVYERHRVGGMVFDNLQSLFGRVIRSGAALITNQPTGHPDSSGTPSGHPPLENFAGLPMHVGGELVGMIGLANRSGGFDQTTVASWEPLILSMSTTMQALRVTRDKHRLTADVDRAQGELQLLHERLRLATEGARIGVWDWDVGENSLVWNPQMFPIYDLPQKEGPLEFDSWQRTLHPEDRDRLLQEVQSALDGDSEFNSQFRIRTRSGGTRSIRGVGTVFRDLHGRPLRMVGCNWDITDEINRVRQQQRAERLEAMGQLTGGVAHDFNNLLAVIAGSLDLLREDSSTPASHRELLDTALTAVDRGSRLTTRLLSFSGRQSLSPGPVDIRRLLTDLGEMLRRTLQKDAQVTLDTNHCQWLAHCDSNHLENVIVNLVVNARDAMDGHGTVTIEASDLDLRDPGSAQALALSAGEYLRIRVRDTGHGMDETIARRACEPFFTTKPAGQGTGLGLSSAEGFALQSGGNLRIISAPGQGTTVELILPRATEQEALVLPRPPAPGHEELGGQQNQEHVVLLVDDNLELQQVVAAQLRALGYGVILAGDARSGLQALENHPEISLILSDVLLPGGCSGPEMLSQAEALGIRLPSLLITGFAGQLPTNQPQTRVLAKPFSRTQLARALEQARAGFSAN